MDPWAGCVWGPILWSYPRKGVRCLPASVLADSPTHSPASTLASIELSKKGEAVEQVQPVGISIVHQKIKHSHLHVSFTVQRLLLRRSGCSQTPGSCSLLVPWMSTLNPGWPATPFLSVVFFWVITAPSTGGHLTKSEAVWFLFILTLTRNQWLM